LPADPRATAIYLLGAVVCSVAVFTLVTSKWIPSFDKGLIWFHAADVGTSYAPLVGPYSRFGWDHPGPALYYVLALPLRLLGMRPTGLLVGALLISMSSALAAVLLAWPRVGAKAAAILAVAVSILCVGLGDQIIDPWNPYVPVLPFGLVVTAAWLWSAGEDRALPYALVAGTFAAQSHVGFVPPILAIGLAAAIIRLVWPGARSDGTPRRVLPMAVLVLVLWAPPIWQQLTAEKGNLDGLVQFFYSGDPSLEPAQGLDAGFGLAARELVPWGAWIGRQTLGLLNTIEPAPTLQLAFPFGLVLLAVILAGRRNDQLMLRLACLVFVGLCAAIYAYAQIHGPPMPYLVVWPRILAMFATVLPLLVLARSPGTLPEGIADSRMFRAAAISMVVATFSVRAMTVAPPDAAMSQVTRKFARAIAKAVPRHTTVRAAATGVPFTVSPEAIAIILIRAGRDARLQPADPHVAGEHRCVSGSDVLPTIALGSGPGIDQLQARGGGKLIARYDPLSPKDRAHADELRDALAEQFRAANREDLVRNLYDGAEWLPLVAPPTVDRPMLDEWVRVAAGDNHRAFAVYQFPPTIW
jgi:hypothetical protein